MKSAGRNAGARNFGGFSSACLPLLPFPFPYQGQRLTGLPLRPSTNTAFNSPSKLACSFPSRSSLDQSKRARVQCFSKPRSLFFTKWHACRSNCAHGGSTSLNFKNSMSLACALREHGSDVRAISSHSGVRVRRAREDSGPLDLTAQFCTISEIFSASCPISFLLYSALFPVHRTKPSSSLS